MPDYTEVRYDGHRYRWQGPLYLDTLLADVDRPGLVRYSAIMALSNGDAGRAFPEPVGDHDPALPPG